MHPQLMHGISEKKNTKLMVNGILKIIEIVIIL